MFVKSRTLSGIAQEAARIICEESLTDYRLAKQKAAQRLGLGEKSPLPKNAEVEAAILEYQRLFGGRQYSERVRRLRETALRSMKLLAQFDPRLVGAAVSGAVSDAHRVQLHAFCDKPELLDAFLHDRGMRLALVDGLVVALRRAGVDLARPADPVLRIRRHLDPVRGPADGARDRKHRREHVHRDAERLVDDPRVEIDVLPKCLSTL
jgi:hypothetical protein